MININAGNFSQGGVRQGQGNSTTLVPEDAEAIRAAAWRAVRRGGRQQPRAGHRREPELVDADSGDRSRLPADPELAAPSTARSSRSRTSTAPRRSRCSGTVVSNTLYGEDVDPTGQIIRIRNQPFKVIGVMSSKGTGAMGNDQDDVIFTPYTTVQKKLQGIQHINNITVSADDGRHRPGRRGDRAGAASCATSSSATIRTTSWSGHSRRWRASAPRRPRP